MKEVREKVKKILENLANAQRGNMGNPEDYIELCSLNEAFNQLLALFPPVRSKEENTGVIKNSICDTCKEICKATHKRLSCPLYKPVCECGKPTPKAERIEELTYYYNTLTGEKCLLPDMVKVVDKINEIIQAYNRKEAGE